MKNRSELFEKYSNSVIPIGHIFNETENIPIDKDYLIPWCKSGKEIFIFPAATAFILKIDKDITQLVTANHAFPEIEKKLISLSLLSLQQNHPLICVLFQ
jgi:hypothetical protein